MAMNWKNRDKTFIFFPEIKLSSLQFMILHTKIGLYNLVRIFRDN